MTVSGVLELFDQLPAFSRFTSELSSEKALRPLMLPSSARPAVVAKLHLMLQSPLLLLTGRVESASRMMQSLEMWLPEDCRVSRFPEPTPLPFDRGPWSDQTRVGRLQVLVQLIGGQHPQIPTPEKPPFIIASARSFLQKTLPRRRFLTATRVLKAGQVINLEKHLANWSAVGYESVSVVESAGQYSRRGGILDIFPVSSSHPVRIELFGNEIDTLRYFDPSTQRSIDHSDGGQIKRVIIPPAREALPSVAGDYAQLLQEAHLTGNEGVSSWRDDIPDLQAGRVFPNIEYYLPLIYPSSGSLLDYLPEDAIVIVDDWVELEHAVRELHDYADQIANEQPSLPPNYPSPLFQWNELSSELQWLRPLILGESETVDDGTGEPLARLAEAFEPGPRYGGQVRPLMNQLRLTQREGGRVVVVSQQASRLAELWREEIRRKDGAIRLSNQLKDARQGVGPGSARDGAAESTERSPLILSATDKPRFFLPQPKLVKLGDEKLSFVQGSLAEGFTLVRREDNQILLDLLTDAEVFGWSRPAPRRWRAPRSIAPETRFADINAGDFVVHLEYGIGRFQGLVVRSVGGMEREYLLVQYANGDVLYVPVHHADRISRWIGPDDRHPPIHRLGERSWGRAKAKAQRAAEELADDLLDLYAARELVPGHAFSKDDEWQAELEASFPYQETEDQLRVIMEVKSDMERPRPMDRLVCGDVGYGKTEVALRAAFKGVMDGKQIAILVPTTVLAQQHYNTFRERLAPFPVMVEMLSRFRTPAHQDRIVKGLREGQVDIVIGTHRLLSDDVSFKDLGIVIIDEEQRFGVAHKEKFKQWRTEVDVLTMTATPIPRTLYMSLTGVRDISVIDTAPADRLPVQTFVGEAEDSRLRRAILRELDRGGQVFFVHNRVQTIEIVYNRLRQLVPGARVAVGHGQMSERRLEQIMVDFANGEIDILLCTTIIESGLDFPNANTLIVDRAEMFGLAQLYQLRGRVGRGVRGAYAYFFHRQWRSLTPEARARLETIVEHTDLGAGYAIAMRDMEIRGAGELLGAEQSGHMSSVGFDLYTRLLANAVKKRRAERDGQQLPAELPEATLIDLPLTAHIPTDYVPDPSLRLRLYRRMALLNTLDEIDEMAAELADRFGPIPDPVHNLLYQLRIKVMAQAAHVVAVSSENGQLRIRIADMDNIDRYRIQRFLGDSARVSRTAIWLGRDMATHEWQVALVQILERLQSIDWQRLKVAA